MKRSFWVAAGVIIVAVIAATYYYTRDVKAEAPAFTTAEVSRGDVISTVEATGTLEAVTTVQVGSQVSGTISALHADFNSKVKQGQVIAELDSVTASDAGRAGAGDRRAAAGRRRARARCRRQTRSLKLTRAHELFDRQLIPKTRSRNRREHRPLGGAAVKGAEAQIVQAQASLNQAQVNLSHTIITRADRRRGHLAQRRRRTDRRGEHAGADAVRARRRPHRDAGERQRGRVRHRRDSRRSRRSGSASMRIRTRRSRARSRRCVCSRSSSRTSSATSRSSTCRIRELKLKPGMTAAVTIEIARADDVLRVPNAALRFTSDESSSAGRAGTCSAPAQADGRGSASPAATARAAVWVLVAGSADARAGAGRHQRRHADTAILDGDLTPGARSRHRNVIDAGAGSGRHQRHRRCFRVRTTSGGGGGGNVEARR